jgi:hypothetical protein
MRAGRRTPLFEIPLELLDGARVQRASHSSRTTAWNAW